ncbi:amidohydrolase family protein [Sphingomonas sp. SRS2]|uniref:amidohydrolase family protein n=1 Tax=Sphingomonas sp. SRS2 TaxID=133190 RepID=UPI000618427E|nr:amidohydrolase family protein [Sphingomonas sp. SRS2]KKC25439.1 hypothetical protein WP12_14490 [Sphingomonas sp. SRS2]
MSDPNSWRDLVQEDALERDLPIIDSHHHIWPVAPAPGLENWDVPDLRSYKRNCGHNIVATVFCEAHANYRTDGPEALRPVGETEYVNRVGEEAEQEGGKLSGLCAAIIANADLMLGADVAAVLDAHRAASPKRLRGTRYMTANDADIPMPPPFDTEPGMMGRAAFRAGFEQVAKRGLSYDAFILHPQLPEVADLARSFPDTKIIIDHVGGPVGIGRFNGTAASFDEWKDGMAAFAAQKNSFVKLGGLHLWFTGMGRVGAERPRTSIEIAEIHGEHILTAIDLFGADRCMFESNFPVDRMDTGATILWNAFKRITAQLDPADRAQLFSGTAARVYGLDQTGG